MSSLAHRAASRRLLLEPFAVLVSAGLALAVGLLAVQWPSPVLLWTGVATVVGICLLKVEVAVLVLVAAGPLELAITWGANSQLSVTKLAGLLCFVSFVFNTIIRRRRLFFDWTHGIVFALLALALLSTPQAHEPGDAMTTTVRYAGFVALFFVVGQFVGDQRLRVQIAWVLSIASSVTGWLALSNFLSGATLSAELPNVSPGDIAFLLGTTLPFTFWLLRERGLRRVAVIFMIALISLSIALTLSRGALVGLGAALLWKVLVERRHMRALVAGIIAGGLALAVVLYFNLGRVETALTAKGEIAHANVVSRLDAWRAASNFAVDHPLLGVGPGNFKSRYGETADVPPGSELVTVVHNAYLDVAAELGVVAAVLLIAYLGLVFSHLSEADRNGRGPPGFASAARLSLIIGIFSALTLSEQYFAPFWLLGGLTAALWHERRPSSVAQS